MKKFADINSKDGVLVTCFYRDDDKSTSMKITRIVSNYTGNAEVAMIGAAVAVLEKDPEDNTTIILPESTAIRVLTVRAAMKKGHDTLEAVLKDWMPREMAEGLSEVIPRLEDALNAHSGKVSVIKARCLYRWELLAAKENVNLANIGDTIVLKGTGPNGQGSFSEDNTIICAENNYLDGTFQVSKKLVGQKLRYFVERKISVIKDGETVKMTTTEAFSSNLEGSNDTSNRILNLLTLRTKTAEALPRVIRKTQVTVSDI